MRKSLVIVRGLPGSGKSKIAHEAYKRRGYWLVEHEHFFKDNAERRAKFDVTRKREAEDWVTEQVIRAVLDGKEVVVTGLFAKSIDVYSIIAASGLPTEAVEVIHAVGGTCPVGKYTRSALFSIKNSWERYRNEKVRTLDPSQGANFSGPRRLINAPYPILEEPIEEEKPKPKFHKRMFLNLTDAEKERLGS